MKSNQRLLTLALLALAPAAANAQAPQVNPPIAITLESAALTGDGTASGQPPEKPFNLEFPGGPVQAFVAAVEKATGGPFNVIIPASAQELQIPPVKVNGVTLRPLLTALSQSSLAQKAVISARQGGLNPGSNIQYVESSFSFTPTEPGAQAVWQLTVRGVPELPVPPPPPPLVRFYQLKHLLESGLKVEDITTAAETAWKMMKLAKEQMPELKFHEETGLLIAAGTESALMVIESVLAAQPQQHPGRARSSGVPGLPPPPQPAQAPGLPPMPNSPQPPVAVPSEATPPAGIPPGTAPATPPRPVRKF